MKLVVLVLLSTILVTPAMATSFQKVSIVPIANSVHGADYQSLPVGDTVLGGIPFHILPSDELNEFITDESGLGFDMPTSGELDMSVENAAYAHILICGTSVRQEYMNALMGNIVFGYSNGSQQTYNLVVGETIRDGATLAGVVTTTSSPFVSTVWRGVSAFFSGGEIVVPMLTIPLTESSALTSITFNDTILHGPGLTVYGLTVEYTPVPEPSSIIALAGGLLALLGMRRRRV